MSTLEEIFRHEHDRIKNILDQDSVRKAMRKQMRAFLEYIRQQQEGSNSLSLRIVEAKGYAFAIEACDVPTGIKIAMPMVFHVIQTDHNGIPKAGTKASFGIVLRDLTDGEHVSEGRWPESEVDFCDEESIRAFEAHVMSVLTRAKLIRGLENELAKAAAKEMAGEFPGVVFFDQGGPEEP